MHDDKGVAVLTAEPEGCKVREIPPSWCIPLIQSKPFYASGSSTFMTTIKHFSLHFSYLCVLSSRNCLREALLQGETFLFLLANMPFFSDYDGQHLQLSITSFSAGGLWHQSTNRENF